MRRLIFCDENKRFIGRAKEGAAFKSNSINILLFEFDQQKHLSERGPTVKVTRNTGEVFFEQIFPQRQGWSLKVQINDSTVQIIDILFDMGENSQRRVNLDLTFGQQSLNSQKLAKWAFLSSAITSAFLLLQEVGPIDFGRQALILSGAMLVLSSALVLRGEGLTWSTYPFLALLTSTSIMAIFNVPFYSCFGALCCLSFLMVGTMKMVQKRRSMKDVVGFTVMFSALCALDFLLLVEEGVLDIAWEKALSPATTLTLTVLGGSLWLTYNQYVNQIRPMNHPLTVLIPLIMFIFSLLGPLTFLLKMHCSQSLFIALISINLVKDIAGALCFSLFAEEMALLARHSFYLYVETGYRIHRREFTRKYDPRTCAKKVEWQEEKCLLCGENKASIVYTSCGHLTACRECFRKAKQIKECLICKQQSNVVEEISFAPSNVKSGYQRRLFIQKKFQLNQYLVAA